MVLQGFHLQNRLLPNPRTCIKLNHKAIQYNLFLSNLCQTQVTPYLRSSTQFRVHNLTHLQPMYLHHKFMLHRKAIQLSLM